MIPLAEEYMASDKVTINHFGGLKERFLPVQGIWLCVCHSSAFRWPEILILQWS
jgi:hypothetical protein